MKLTQFTDYSLRVLIYLATQPDRRATVAEIGRAFDCAIAGSCRLRGVLGEAVNAFYDVLDRTTLADLVRNRHTLGQVLHIVRPTTRRAAGARP